MAVMFDSSSVQSTPRHHGSLIALKTGGRPARPRGVIKRLKATARTSAGYCSLQVVEYPKS